jgi:hypothetical protein
MQVPMNISLAAVFGLWALAAPHLAAGVAPSKSLLPLSQETQPAQDAPPSSPSVSPGAVQEPSQPIPQPKAEPTTSAPAKAQEPQKPESKTGAPKAKVAVKKRRHRKKAAAAVATPEKKVVHNGGTADPVIQLAPGMSEEQASSQRQSTSELLSATDVNLKQISSRQLNSTQQDSVSQIRKYIEQAKAAEEAGDVQRAHNLASKAVMLSDDLAKH